jgi:hypothetical protein
VSITRAVASDLQANIARLSCHRAHLVPAKVGENGEMHIIALLLDLIAIVATCEMWALTGIKVGLGGVIGAGVIAQGS